MNNEYWVEQAVAGVARRNIIVRLSIALHCNCWSQDPTMAWLQWNTC